MKIIAIETSCDETSIAIVENGQKVLSNIVSSQVDMHATYGGVLPELASRLHVEKISFILKEALSQAKCHVSEIDAIAVTQGPGLIGSLHVGMIAAKTLAWYLDKPLIPVHHIAAHIYANQFVQALEFPVMALVVSGGHTELVYLREEYHFEVLGSTQDDAVGEAFDKVARIMGLGYPGGVEIEHLAKQGGPHYQLPSIKTQQSLDFSFSGLKSAALQFIQKNPEYNKADLAFAFQEVVVDELIKKTRLALEQYPSRHLVVGGGVSANQRLRSRILALKEIFPDLIITIPPMWCCTDNAAMIGAAAYQAYQKGHRANLTLSAQSSLEYL
jgi:N6-L-threonylcarbamoyladenine synthase